MSDLRNGARAAQPRPTRKNALLLFLLAGVGLFAVPLLTLIFSGALQNVDESLGTLLFNLVYYLCFLGLPIALSLRRRPELLTALRPDPISIPSAILVVLMALLGVFLVNYITLLWSIPLQRLGFNVDGVGLAVPTDTAGLVLCVLHTAVLPGVFEEFLFRGMLLSAFEGEGTRRAMVISSLLFMLMHGSLVGAPAEFLLGMMMAMLVVYTGSIYAGLIYHTTHNAAVVLMQFVQNRISAQDAAQPADYLTAIGGLLGVFALLIDILFFGMMLWLVLRLLRMRAQSRGLEILPRRRERLSGGERGLLIAGVAVTCLLYVADIIQMLM